MRRTTFFCVLVNLAALSACAEVTDVDDINDGVDDDGVDPGEEPDAEPVSVDAETDSDPLAAVSGGTTLSTGCSSYGSSVYTPFKNYGPVTLGSVAAYPWRGPSSSYPNGNEAFEIYGSNTTVECSTNRSTRNYLDVTSGCLRAASVNGWRRGQMTMSGNGGYRSFALPYDPASGRQVAWQDQGVEYRFYYSSWSSEGVNPGFKAFVRYLTEYDLYVASWRKDGVVQIQKKKCGTYTTLKRISGFGAPKPNTWHTIRFDIKGSTMNLYLDGKFVMSATDTSIKTGTAGIRTDATQNAYIDDWRVYAP